MSEKNVSPQEELLQQIKNCIVYYRHTSRKDEHQYKLHHRITAMMDNYVNLANGEENRQLAAGRLLWKVKDYFYTGFNRNNGKLVDHILNTYSLSDKDKVNFANYAVTNRLYRYLEEKAFNNLSNIHHSSDYTAKQSRQVLTKVMTALTRDSKDLKQYAEKARRLVCYMNFYGLNVPLTDRETVKHFAETMFVVSNRLNEYNQTAAAEQKRCVSLLPLSRMLTKTKGLKEKHARMGSLFETEYPAKTQKPVFDVVALQEVLKLYRAKVLNYRDFNKFDNILDISVGKMATHFVSKYEIKSSEVNGLIAAVSEKYTKNILQRKLNQIGLAIGRTYKETQPSKSSVTRRKVSPHAVGVHFYREKLGKIG